MNVQKNIPSTLNPSQSQTQSKNIINQLKITIIPQPGFAKLLKYYSDTIQWWYLIQILNNWFLAL